MVIGAGDQQIRINRTGGGPGGAQVSMSTAETGAVKMSVSSTGQMHMEIKRLTMASLAQQLTPMFDRPVVDHTGLKGAYTIALDLSIQDVMQAGTKIGSHHSSPRFPSAGPVPAGAPGLTASDPSGGSIFMSVQQLGLKLEKQKEPVETVIVESASKDPTEN